MHFRKNYTVDKSLKEDLRVSSALGSLPFLSYIAAIVGVGAVASMGYVPPLTLQKALEPLPYVSLGGLGLGSFCFYVRRDIRKILKEAGKQESKKD
jgi:hypothetical protein